MTAPQAAGRPRVSVVIPCYNASPFLAEVIESVINQSRSDWELTVVDDGSTDGSAGIAQRFADADSRIRVIRGPNGGVARARNVGLHSSCSSSEYLLFLDADDALERDMLDTLVSHLDRSPEAGIAHCGVRYVNEDSRPVQLSVPRIQARFTPTRFWLRALRDDEVETPFACIFCTAPLVPSVALIRRSYYTRTKGWDESIGQIGEDIELYLELALVSKVHYVPVALVRYRVHGSQATVTDPEYFTNQVCRLYARWSSFSERQPEEQEIIKAAIRFKHRRHDALTGYRNARSEWAQGSYVLAMRAVLGAFRNALRSLLLDP